MATTRFYRWALLTPLVLPILAWGILLAAPQLFDGLGAVVAPVVWLAFSLVYGGIPYLLVAGGLLLWMRRKEWRQIRRASYVAPVLMLPVFAVCMAAYAVLNGAGRSDFWEQLGNVIIVLGPFVIVFGYGYAVLTDGVRHIASRKGWLTDNGPAAA